MNFRNNVEEFDHKHRIAEAVACEDGYLYFPTGVRRTNAPPRGDALFGIGMHEPESVVQRTEYKIKRVEELIRRASKRFYELQQSLLNDAKHGAMSGYGVPSDAAERKSELLQVKAEYEKRVKELDVLKAEFDRIPEVVAWRRRQQGANQASQRASDFHAEIKRMEL